MARLALVAVLLTVAVPTASRVISTLAPTLAPVLMEMCTTAGLQVRDVSAVLPGDEPAPPPVAPMDACDYCVLSAPPPLLLLALLLLALLPVRTPIAGRRLALPRPPRNLRGLGSQAPPLPL